jgi:hypothetical protein
VVKNVSNRKRDVEMMDKTLVSIISMIFGGVGLIGAITKYDFPNARKTTYGKTFSF